MNAEENLSDSDSLDEDYVPKQSEELASEEELSDSLSEGNEADGAGDVVDSRKRKSKTNSKNTRKKRHKNNSSIRSTSTDQSEQILETEKQVSEEDKKKKADLLWADFLKDCGSTAKKNIDNLKREDSNNSSCVKGTSVDVTLDNKQAKKFDQQKKLSDIFNLDKKKTDGEEVEVQVYKFAGEEVRVEKKDEQKKKLSGVGALLSQLNKKNKLSTLEKSKLDWEMFKSSEGIDEEIKTHNRGKNGFLEKQDFLQRTDLRQFELEKSLRSSARRSNR